MVSATYKYEIVIGVPDDKFVNGRMESQVQKMICKWQEYAKEYYNKTDVYVSAIAIEGKAIYNTEWGCPKGGERTLTFNCTLNPRFINSAEVYGEGIKYIVGKLKKFFNQHTITITIFSDNVYITYYTDAENEKLNKVIDKISNMEDIKHE